MGWPAAAAAVGATLEAPQPRRHHLRPGPARPGSTARVRSGPRHRPRRRRPGPGRTRPLPARWPPGVCITPTVCCERLEVRSRLDAFGRPGGTIARAPRDPRSAAAIARLLGELDDRQRSQAAIEVVVQAAPWARPGRSSGDGTSGHRHGHRVRPRGAAGSRMSSARHMSIAGCRHRGDRRVTGGVSSAAEPAHPCRERKAQATEYRRSTRDRCAGPGGGPTHGSRPSDRSSSTASRCIPSMCPRSSVAASCGVPRPCEPWPSTSPCPRAPRTFIAPPDRPAHPDRRRAPARRSGRGEATYCPRTDAAPSGRPRDDTDQIADQPAPRRQRLTQRIVDAAASSRASWARSWWSPARLTFGGSRRPRRTTRRRPWRCSSSVPRRA